MTGYDPQLTFASPTVPISSWWYFFSFDVCVFLCSGPLEPTSPASDGDRFATARSGHANPMTGHHWEFVADDSPTSAGYNPTAAAGAVHPPTHSMQLVLPASRPGTASSTGRKSRDDGTCVRWGVLGGFWC